MDCQWQLRPRDYSVGSFQVRTRPLCVGVVDAEPFGVTLASALKHMHDNVRSSKCLCVIDICAYACVCACVCVSYFLHNPLYFCFITHYTHFFCIY